MNVLCERCLVGAYAQQRAGVSIKIVKKAAAEVLESRKKVRATFVMPWVLGVSLGVLVMAGVGLFLDIKIPPNPPLEKGGGGIWFQHGS